MDLGAPPPGPQAQRLLQAAVRLVGAEGPRALTHRRIESEAGMSRGAARYHLGSHEQIVRDTLSYIAGQEARMIGESVAKLAVGALGSRTPTLPDLAEAVVSALISDRTLARARYELLLEAGRRPELVPAVARWRAEFIEATRQGVAAFVDSPQELAETIVPLFDGLVFGDLVTDQSHSPGRARRALEQILGGAKGPAAESG